MSEVQYLEDLTEGRSFASHSRTITEADVNAFVRLSGDANPLHTDEEFARSRGFGRRVVHGALVLSVATGLRQEMGIFAGSMLAMLELRTWAFRAPVFFGDTVHTVTTVVNARTTSSGGRGVVVQRIDVVNQDDTVVQSGEMVSLIAARPTAVPGG